MFKKIVVVISLLLLIDQAFTYVARKNALTSGIIEGTTDLFLEGLSDGTISLTGAEKQCYLERTVLVYLYQVCFRPFLAGMSNSDKNYTLFYHRPKPYFSVIMPARRPSSYYFSEVHQGETVLYIRSNLEVEYRIDI